MARSGYQYGTSPRKLEPDYTRRTKNKQKPLKVVKNNPKKQASISKTQKIKHAKTTVTVLGIILLLLTISCRNSQIDKQFSQIQSQKQELATLQKENEQLKVSIENSVNITNIEKIAKEELGMQKLSSKQTVYVTLPKKDYVETTTEKVVKNESENWFQKLIEKFK